MYACVSAQALEELERNNIDFFLSRRTTWDHWKSADSAQALEELERNNIDFFLSRRTTWDHWKSAESLAVLLSFLLAVFCDLLRCCTHA